MNRYKSILKLETRHEYYTSGLCADLTFSPTAETASLIANRRLKVRYSPAGLEVFAPLDRDGNFVIPLEENLAFGWLLKAESEDFFRISELPEKDRSGQYFIGNRKDSADFITYGGLYDETAKKQEGGIGSLVKTFSFNYILNEKTTEHVVKLDRTPVLNVETTDFKIEVEPNDETAAKNAVEVKSFDRETNQLRLKTKSSPITRIIKISYPVAAKASENAFALLELKLNKTAEASYSLNFKAKRRQWQYLITTGKKTSLEPSAAWRLNGADKAFPQELVVTELNKNTAPVSDYQMANLIWDRIRAKIDSASGRAYFLRSVNPLPVKEKTLSDLVIQRGKNGDDWENVITELSSPTLRDQSIRLVENPTIS